MTETFEPSLPSVVKSIRQRDLLNEWLRLSKAANGLPDFATYHVGSADELIEMMVFQVIRESDEPQFLIIHEGARMSAAYGNDYDGHNAAQKRYMHTNIGPKRTRHVIGSYLACLEHRLPIYSILMVKDEDGKEVAYERLLLPFGTAGVVDHIVGSFKTISIDGSFKIRNLMSLSADPPVTIIRAVINGRFTAPVGRRKAESADEIIEV